MEGVSGLSLAEMTADWRQRTVKAAIDCTGIGVHSGRRVQMQINPAPIDHGIVFRRTDLRQDVAARYDNVIDTRLCTVLGRSDVRVGTIEHLMAALFAMGIDNALIEVDGAELPILDGSASPFLFLLDCVGGVAQDAPRHVIEIRRTVRVEAEEAWAELRPLAPLTRGSCPTLDMDVSIDFSAAAIGRQAASLCLTPDEFRHRIAAARTFTQMHEVAQLQAAGLARGGSLDNAVVVDGGNILNPGGLRMENEFASHKLVDAVGDLALAGGPLHGRYVAHRAGHALNNRLLHALFANPAAWRPVAIDPLAEAA